MRWSRWRWRNVQIDNLTDIADICRPGRFPRSIGFLSTVWTKVLVFGCERANEMGRGNHQQVFKQQVRILFHLIR